MINNIMNIGLQSLLTAQVGIAVTGENISNVGNEDYSRRTVNLETRSQSLQSGFFVGNGAAVAEIERHYSTFIEDQYLDMSSQESFWNAEVETLYNLETIFGESDDYGVSTALDQFLASLEALAQSPDDQSLRQEALDYAGVLAETLGTIDGFLEKSIEGLDSEISGKVDSANTLIQEIADLNAEIVGSPGNSTLLDQRDAKVRELAGLVDVTVIRNDDNTYDILTTGGLTLVGGTEAFKLAFEEPQVIEDLDKDSAFDGSVFFEGEYSQELYVEVLTGGAADGTSNAATFRVSIDGGKTWLEDGDGEPLVFTAGGDEDKTAIGGVSFWFGKKEDSSATPAGELSAGDRFTVVSTSSVYWCENTSSKVNVAPLELDGDSSGARLSGGEIAGLLAVRNDSLMSYQETLDALANELAWQVNYQHSQGASVDHSAYDISINRVDDADVPLEESGLDYADRLAQGSLSMAFYDSDTEESLGVLELDFSSVVPPGLATFDPEKHSLEDVAAAMNASYGSMLTADISNGQLVLDAADGVEFAYAGDTTGLLATLGLNTFFEGSDAGNLGVRSELKKNPALMSLGHVDGAGLVAEGDNTNALALAGIADLDVRLDLPEGTGSQTLAEHLHSLVAQVGLDTDAAARNQTLTNAQAEALYDRQESISGVSMDEELALLTKHQESYQAASKLIQASQEMFEILMDLKS